jgi:KDO2-lipid IV(A) lauroyltransferase
MSRQRSLSRRAFDYAAYLLFLGVSFVARRLPPRGARLLGLGLGAVWHALDGHHRRLAQANIAAALGGELDPAAQGDLCRACFGHLGTVLIELARGGQPQDVVFDGEEHYVRALAQGRGLVAISAHLGNWEALSAHCRRHGKGHILAKKIHNPHIDRIVRLGRQEAGLWQLDPSGSGREIVRVLKAGGPVSFLLDQSAPRHMGEEVDFFGRPASTFTGAAALALRLGCPVILFLTFRRPDGRMQIHYSPLELVKTGDFSKDVLTNTQNFTHAIEAWIRRYPEQWLWVHNRGGELRRYPEHWLWVHTRGREPPRRGLSPRRSAP